MLVNTNHACTFSENVVAYQDNVVWKNFIYCSPYWLLMVIHIIFCVIMQCQDMYV